MGRKAAAISPPRHAEARQAPLDALEEQVLPDLGVPVQLDDVAVVARHEVECGGDDALLVGTRHQKDHVGFGHAAVYPARIECPATPGQEVSR